MLGELAAHRRITAVGIDLSAAAVRAAARRFPALTWVVANADRHLPILDRSVDLVLSVNARRNPVECARVLARPGYLLAVVPAADDLIELRELVQGRRVERDRIDTLLEEHHAAFTLSAIHGSRAARADARSTPGCPPRHVPRSANERGSQRRGPDEPRRDVCLGAAALRRALIGAPAATASPPRAAG